MNTGQTQHTRRNFLKASAIATMTAALATAPRLSNSAHAQDGMTDIDILNYALTLEHLESRAYKDVNSIGMLTGKAQEYFVTFGDQEAAHVVALTGTITKLGGTPVRAQAEYNIPTFNNEQEVLDYFQMLEELGAAAYLGAAPLIQDSELLTAAVSIHNVEGQHAAVLSDLVGKPVAPAFAESKTMDEVVATIQPILSTAPEDWPETGQGQLSRYGSGPRFAQ